MFVRNRYQYCVYVR